MCELEEWVTAKKVAVLIGRHFSQVYRWIDAGRLETGTNACRSDQSQDKHRYLRDLRRCRPLRFPP